jgi:hypothetical protein
VKLPPDHEAALLRALHSRHGAGARWAATVRPDDETLLCRIGEELGIWGGFGMPGLWVDYRGGRNPRVEIRIGAEIPLELSGRELLAAAREALKLARPGELF